MATKSPSSPARLSSADGNAPALNPNVWQTEIASVRNGYWIFHELFVNGHRKERTRFPEQGFFHCVGKGVAGPPDRTAISSGQHPAGMGAAGGCRIGHARGLGPITQPNSRSLCSLPTSFPWQAPPCRTRGTQRPLLYRKRADRTSSGSMASGPGQRPSHLLAGCGRGCAQSHSSPRRISTTWCESKARPISRRMILFSAALPSPTRIGPLMAATTLTARPRWKCRGAVQAQFARHCAFERCRFQRLGGYGLELARGCEQDTIVGNDLHDLGAGGIRVGEGEYNQAVEFPCGGNLITDNHVHHIGLVNAPGVGIFVLLSGRQPDRS